MAYQQSTLFRSWQELTEHLSTLVPHSPPAFAQHLLDEQIELGKTVFDLTNDVYSLEDRETKKELSHILRRRLTILRQLLPQYISSDAFVSSALTQINLFEGQIDHFLQKRKRMLIFYFSMGNGHRVAAEAIAEGMRHYFGSDYIVETLDFLETASTFFNSTSKAFYDASSKSLPDMWRLWFEATDNPGSIKIIKYLTYPVIMSKLEEMIQEKNPDLLVSTFPLFNYTIKHIWSNPDNAKKIVTVITDSIRVHKAWLMTDTDYFIVSNPDTADTLRKSGIDEKRIQILGFPLRMGFYQPVDPAAVARRFHLDPAKKTILYSIGTGGNKDDLQPLYYLNEHLDPDRVQIAAVFGNNRKLKESFEKKLHPRVSIKTLGWTDQMPALMSVADLIITKPGGAIVMESVDKELPMVITRLIPGQEEGNLALLERHNLGRLAITPREILKAVLDMIDARHDKAYKQRFQKAKVSHSTEKICSFLHDLMDNPSAN